MVDNITELIINNFDFGLIISINVLVYLLVKIIISISPKAATNKWCKILTTVIVSIILGFVYKTFNNIEIIKIVNSCICATVVWDWIIKPVLHKFKIDYTNNE